MPTPTTGVYRRDRSSHWQWRIKAPTDLRKYFSGEWASRVSLKTGDLRTANVKAAQLRAAWLVHFEKLRQTHQNSPRLVANFLPMKGLPGPSAASPEPFKPLPAPPIKADLGSRIKELPVGLNDAGRKQRNLRDVFERWKVSGEKPRTYDSIGAMERALRQYESQFSSLCLEDITRDMGDSFRAWLRTECRTPKTASDRLTAIKSLLKFASETLQWITRHPWRGLNIKATTTNKRRPWNQEELSILFGHPLHTSLVLPDTDRPRTQTDDGGLAAYWIPLLGLFTGARLGELCQLQPKDILASGDLPVIVISDEGVGQRVKTKAGRRAIPIHSELVRLGFLDYATAVSASGSTSLWPQLKVREGKPSDHFGRWFKRHRSSLGLAGDEGPTFHYFRHTVRPLMRKAGISSAVMDKVTGHETRGSVGDAVYDHWNVTELRPAVEAISFPFIRLERVFPEAPCHPGKDPYAPL